MSVDLLWEYVLTGKSEDLAEFVQNHIIEDDFSPETLGIEYPEYLDLENPLDAQEIIDENIDEITILIYITYRRNFDNRSVQDDIFEAMKNQYPNLKISYRRLDEWPYR